MPMPRKDLTGKRFGRLVVVGPYDKVKGQLRWECICDCGATHIAYGSSLKGGSTRSCGCLLRDFNKTIIVHGCEPKRLYRIWSGMKCRCSDQRNKDYPRYGGRGITVCQEWREYIPFRDWALANGYAEDLSLDRINVNGNYCPENCRWATPKEQGNNRRNNRMATYMGETKTFSEWADQFGIDICIFHAAMRRGRTMDEIVRTYAKNQPMREGTKE